MAVDTGYKICTINGLPMIDKADGESINCTQQNPNVNILNGQGRSVAILNHNAVFLLTLTLLEDSPYNDYLTGLYRAQQALPGGRVILSTAYNQIGSTEFFVTDEAYIRMLPSITANTAGATKVWNIDIPNMRVFNPGGRPIP